MGPRLLKTLSMLLRVLQLILALFIVGVASFNVYQFSHNRLGLTNGRSGQLPHALYAVEVIVRHSFPFPSSAYQKNIPSPLK